MRTALAVILLSAWLVPLVGCVSVSPQKEEQVERAQQTGIYSYQRIQRQKNAQAVAASRH